MPVFEEPNSAANQGGVSAPAGQTVARASVAAAAGGAADDARKADAEEEATGAMSFGEHLEELRHRLIYALVGVVVISVLTFYFGEQITAWLVTPLLHALHRAGLPAQTYGFKVTTGFALYMKVGLVAALVVGAPWLVYQLWRFIAPGLYRSERRIAALLAPFSVIMTVLGVLFYYYLLLPLALVFLIGFSTTYPTVNLDEPQFSDRMMERLPQWSHWITGRSNGGPGSRAVPHTAPAGTQAAPAIFAPVLDGDPPSPGEGQLYIRSRDNQIRIFRDGVWWSVPLTNPTILSPLIDIDEYLDFVLFTGLAVIIAFQVPVVMAVAGRIGLMDPKVIAKTRKYCIFGCFILAAVLTPTGDPFNLTLLAVPLWALFEMGLLIMRFTYRTSRAA